MTKDRLNIEVKVIDKKHYGDDIFELTLDHNFNKDTRGTFVSISPKPIRRFRPFSVASNGDNVRLIIKRVGRATEELYKVNVGDTILMKNRLYRTHFPQKLEGTTTFISMGVGVAPMFSYLDLERVDGYLLNSVRYDKEIINHYGNIIQRNFVTREQKASDMFGKMLNTYGRRLNINDVPKTDQYLICGSKVFADNISKEIKNKYPKAKLYVEAYG